MMEEGFLTRLKHGVSDISPAAELVKEKMANLTNTLSQGLNTITNPVASIPTSGSNTARRNAANSTDKPSSSLNDLRRGSSNNPSQKYEISDYKVTQFENILNAENIDLNALRKLSWNGIPDQYRCLAWHVMLGYCPTNKSRRVSTIAKKRQDYQELLPVYYSVPDSERSAQELDILRQILKDLPRTCPDSPFFQQEPIQRMMERILFVWSLRHPASGYVQGMDDLLTPLLYLALTPYAPEGEDVMRLDVARVDAKVLRDVEADAYWCFGKLLDGIQDHYTFSQPGLQRMILRLDDLIHRLDNSLYSHLQQETVQYMQFGFRWMNCLLLRELPFHCILRLWDTYISEQFGGFESFHVYVCAVLLKTFQNELMGLRYEELLMFLQDLPTKNWTEEEMEPILSQAFILSTLFDNSPSHLNS